ARQRLYLVEDDEGVGQMVEAHLVPSPWGEQREQELIEGRDDHVGLPGVEKEILTLVLQAGVVGAVGQAMKRDHFPRPDVVSEQLVVFLGGLIDNGKVR